MDKIETLPPPPGVVGSLKAGFDAIASNLSVILLPLALDLFLWLGPRLRVDGLFRSFFDEMLRTASSYGGFQAADLKAFQESSSMFLEQLQNYNLLSVLRTFPVGIFSLMSGAMPVQTPMGAPSAVYVGSVFTLLGWTVLLTLIGWVLGGLFFRWVSLVVTDSSQTQKNRLGPAVLQTVFLSIMFFAAAMMVGIPLLLLFSVMTAINPLIAQGLLLLLGLLSMWLVVPVFFTPHGIFLRQQNVFSSIHASLKMARFTLPTSSLFVVSVILLAFGLNYLWSIPSPDSWIALVGIAGHAFITTALLAASFIYYRDMQVWLQTVLEKLKANSSTQQA